MAEAPPTPGRPMLVVEHQHTDPWLHRFGSPSMAWCQLREVETPIARAGPPSDEPGGGELETVIHAWLGREKGETEWVARISGPYSDVVRSTERLFRGESRDAAVALAVGEEPASVTLAAVVEARDLHLLVRRAWHHSLTLALIRVYGASGSEVVAALDRGDDGQALAWADRVLVCQAAVRRCSLGASDPAALVGLPARLPAYSLAPRPEVPPTAPASPRVVHLPGVRTRLWFGLALVLVAVGATVLFSGALRPGSPSTPFAGAAARAVAAPTPPTPTPIPAPTEAIPTVSPTPAIPASVQLASFPPQRTREAVAFDAAHGTVVLFGGAGGTASALGDTWIFSGGAWTRARPRTSPPPRAGAAMAYNPATSHVVLVGGTSATGAPLDDTWIWDGASWSQVSVRNRPAAGPPVALVYDSARADLVLLTRAGTTTTARMWTFADGSWNAAPPAGATTASPGAALVDDPALGRLVLVDVAAAVTRTWDGRAWSDVAGASTPAGTSARAAYDATAKQLVMIVSAPGQAPGALTFDGTAWHQTVSAIGPVSVGAMTATAAQVVAFGGLSAADDLSQAWRWSPAGWGG